jgi:hypothetical protein
MKAYINGKHTKSGIPFYSLMEMSAASGLPIYQGEKDADVVFNWGGGQYDPPKDAKVINRNPIFDKYQQAKTIYNAGVNIPRPYDMLKDVKHFPVVRKPLNSYGGHGIVLIKNAAAGEKVDTWYQEFVDKESELRVYFFNKEIKMVEEKIVKNPKMVTWNFFNCLRWERRREFEDNLVLARMVINAANAIRIDWGAADIMVDKYGKLWICEVNSRPSCWGGKTPKRSMKVENNVYQITDGSRDDLDLSARMWANCMARFIKAAE